MSTTPSPRPGRSPWDANKQLPLSQLPSMGHWGLATLAGLMGLLTMAWYARRRATGGQPT